MMYVSHQANFIIRQDYPHAWQKRKIDAWQKKRGCQLIPAAFLLGCVITLSASLTLCRNFVYYFFGDVNRSAVPKHSISLLKAKHHAVAVAFCNARNCVVHKLVEII